MMAVHSREFDRRDVWPVIRERAKNRGEAIHAMQSHMMHSPAWPDDFDECHALAIQQTEGWYGSASK